MPSQDPVTRRLRQRRLLAGLGLAAVVLAGAACSSPAPSQQDLTAALVSSGLSQKVADCTSKALTTSLSSSELAEITERGSGGAPVDDPKRADDSYDVLIRAMAECRDLQAANLPTTTTTLPIGGTGSTTTLDDGPRTDGAQLNPASTTTTTP